MQLDFKADSIIGTASRFEGSYAVRGNLRIDGKFEGRSLLVNQLMIGPQARVKSAIQATSVVVEGIVIGNITALHRVLLLATARVLGDIKSPELIIQEGVVLEGKCTVSDFKIEDTRHYIERLYAQPPEEAVP